MSQAMKPCLYRTIKIHVKKNLLFKIFKNSTFLTESGAGSEQNRSVPQHWFWLASGIFLPPEKN